MTSEADQVLHFPTCDNNSTRLILDLLEQIRAKRLAKLSVESSSSSISGPPQQKELKPVVVSNPAPKTVVPSPVVPATVASPSASSPSITCPVSLFVSEPQERWENGTLQVILRVSLLVIFYIP